MTELKSLSQLEYSPDPIPDDFSGLAMDVASECGYDKWEEHLLHASIRDIKWLTKESAEQFFSNDLQPVGEYSPQELLRIDWHTWSIPQRFNGLFEKAVVERVESVVVAAPILITGEVFTYGLGPEYNWLYWEEQGASADAPPQEVFDALNDLIKGDWKDKVAEYADGHDAYISSVHPLLQAAVSSALDDAD